MKKMLCAMFMAAALQAPAQCLHDSLIVNWHQAGFEGVIPEFSTVIDVTTFGAVAGDSIDDQPAVVAAINSLNNTAGVIYFPAGNYILKSPIILPDSTVIRGAGSDSTSLTFDFGNFSANSFNLAGSVTLAFYPIISELNKGSAEIRIANANTIFSAGDEIEIRLANGSWDTNPAPWADYAVGHLSRVDSVSGDTLWMHEPLRMEFDTSLSPEIRKINPRRYSGLECFKMMRADSNSTGVNFGVNFSYAKNCWLRGVESEKSICAHVSIETSSHIQISGCYFHDSYLYDGASTHGYGVVVYSHSCSNKIEDNIFRMLRHAMIAKQGANGNVFGYNYSRETNRSETIADYAADICMHGHYAFANLFEGNIVQNLQIDQAWGPSGPFNTFFRNKIENYGVIMSSGAVESNRQNFVGNDISNATILHGFYSLSGTGHFEFGNNVKGTITPNGTAPLADVTYYLDSIPPAFWNIPAALPSIGIPNSFVSDINPACQRYNNGYLLTRCNTETDTTIITNLFSSDKPNDPRIKIFAANENIFVEIENSIQENARIELYSCIGQRLHSEKIKLTGRIDKFTIPVSEFVNGIYFLSITLSETKISRKILLEN